MATLGRDATRSTKTTTLLFSTVCFDGMSLVTMHDGSMVRMRDLKLGDQVIVARSLKNGKFRYRSSPLLAMDIYQKYTRHASVQYLAIHVASNITISPLHITPAHSLLVTKNEQNRENFLFASEVNVDDYLHSITMGEHRSTAKVRVSRIESVELFDAYAPLTMEGNLVVNNLVVSCYGSFSHATGHCIKLFRRWFLFSLFHIHLRGSVESTKMDTWTLEHQSDL